MINKNIYLNLQNKEISFGGLKRFWSILSRFDGSSPKDQEVLLQVLQEAHNMQSYTGISW